MRIGFVGLGVMGRPMAKNLIKAGYDLLVYDINPEGVHELEECGAAAAPDVRNIAKNCSTIITMLPNGPHVKSAPVSGAYAGAVEGTLAIMVGGSEKDVTDALPLLNVMGGKIVHIGPSGCGSACKLCNQIMIAASLAAVSESMMLAKKSGCDISKVFDAVRSGFAGSKVLESQVPKILEHTFQPGFRIDLHLKDLRNVEAAAKEFGAPIPITEFTLKIMQELHDENMGGLDNSGVAKYYEKLAGCSYVDD